MPTDPRASRTSSRLAPARRALTLLPLLAILIAGIASWRSVPGVSGSAGQGDAAAPSPSIGTHGRASLREAPLVLRAVRRSRTTAGTRGQNPAPRPALLGTPRAIWDAAASPRRHVVAAWRPQRVSAPGLVPPSSRAPPVG